MKHMEVTDALDPAGQNLATSAGRSADLQPVICSFSQCSHSPGAQLDLKQFPGKLCFDSLCL